MRVIRRRHNDPIHVLPLQEVPIIDVCAAPLIRSTVVLLGIVFIDPATGRLPSAQLLLGPLHPLPGDVASPLPVDITHGDHLTSLNCRKLNRFT